MKERTTQGAPAPAPTCPSSLQVALFFLAAAALFWWTKRPYFADGWTEDLPVYTHAVRSWIAGGNPYDGSQSPLYFLYPPVFLFLAGLVSHLIPANWGPVVYLVVNVTALCVMPLVLARYFFRQKWLGLGFALLLFFASPRFTGMLALETMNIASTFYCLAFVAAIPGLRRNRWLWFYLAVYLAAIVKITFLSLLLLPLLAARRQWWRSIACGLAVVGTNLLEMTLAPVLYHGYEWSLQQGILISQAYGYGVFGIMKSHFFNLPGLTFAPFAASALVGMLLTGILLWLKRQLTKAGWSAAEFATNGNWLALVVTAIILVNPRVMQYDMDVALLAGFVLWVYALRITHLLWWMTAFFMPALALPFLMHNLHMHGVYTTLLVLTAFVLGGSRIWQEAKAGDSEIELGKLPSR